MASMEPGSEDPGYRRAVGGTDPARACFNGAGVRRPRIPHAQRLDSPPVDKLQWSRGPKTPDTSPCRRMQRQGRHASMEPGSEDPGYEKSVVILGLVGISFNGAGVRRPRIPGMSPGSAPLRTPLQWSRGPKTPDTSENISHLLQVNVLQWSRGPKTPDTYSSDSGEHGVFVLQWSRGPKTPDT